MSATRTFHEDENEVVDSSSSLPSDALAELAQKVLRVVVTDPAFCGRSWQIAMLGKAFCQPFDRRDRARKTAVRDEYRALDFDGADR